jgi:hypothetical protein
MLYSSSKLNVTRVFILVEQHHQLHLSHICSYHRLLTRITTNLGKKVFSFSVFYFTNCVIQTAPQCHHYVDQPCRHIRHTTVTVVVVAPLLHSPESISTSITTPCCHVAGKQQLPPFTPPSWSIQPSPNDNDTTYPKYGGRESRRGGEGSGRSGGQGFDRRMRLELRGTFFYIFFFHFTKYSKARLRVQNKNHDYDRHTCAAPPQTWQWGASATTMVSRNIQQRTSPQLVSFFFFVSFL